MRVPVLIWWARVVDSEIKLVMLPGGGDTGAEEWLRLQGVLPDNSDL